jgi:hypothetical protein
MTVKFTIIMTVKVTIIMTVIVTIIMTVRVTIIITVKVTIIMTVIVTIILTVIVTIIITVIVTIILTVIGTIIITVVVAFSKWKHFWSERERLPEPRQGSQEDRIQVHPEPEPEPAWVSRSPERLARVTASTRSAPSQEMCLSVAESFPESGIRNPELSSKWSNTKWTEPWSSGGTTA